MNLSSLCTAIRSQLYFSQITAWSDSIRKNDNNELHSTGRFKYMNNWLRKPRLDIFYRIKPYDYSSIDYFNSKPIVHNFPHVIINDNYTISVSLKSLPRMQSIPMISVKNSLFCWNKATNSDSKLHSCKCGNVECERMGGKPNCISTDDENDEVYFNDPHSNVNVISHREKQVLKYKRLIRKRDSGKRRSESICSTENNQLPELGSINSIRPPLYQAISTNIPEPVQNRKIEMISIGTQTTFNNTSCDSCGNIMSILCLNCDNLSNKELEAFPNTTGKQNQDCSINKAELLLNAIQRTPNKNRILRENRTKSSYNSKSFKKLSENDCVLCKRQKTQHIYQHEKQPIDELYNNNSIDMDSTCSLNSYECGCNNTTYVAEQKQIFSEKFHPSPETQFKTPTSKPPSSITSNFSTFCTNNDSLNAYTPSLCVKNKTIPKVNLTEIFCNSSVDLSSINAFSSLPIKIANINANIEIPMQKSSSAPSLPSTASSCLSPRFIKQSATYQFKRVRHSSERSDRSSIGSDEQLSDEDLDLLGYGYGVCNPNMDSSIFKNRLFSKSSKPLLGNLEESLLQRRIAPKKYVNGFKILLGASGGFCPPQVTIPAASFFYELNDDILNTPYVVRKFAL